MKNVEYRSQNGRWGLSLVCPDEVYLSEDPTEGSIEKLGKFEGLETFVFTPGKTGAWYCVSRAKGGVDPIAGCRVIHNEDLQGGNNVAILEGGGFFAFRAHGYKCRSSEIVAVSKGARIHASAGILAAMGLIPTPKRETIKPEIPALGGALADALKKAGIG